MLDEPSGLQINAEPWPFSQSSFCDRRRPAASVQTSCSRYRCYWGSQGSERICRKQRWQSHVTFSLSWKRMTETRLFLREGSPQQRKYWVLHCWEAKTGARWGQVLMRQHPGAGLGSLNCAPTALQPVGSENHSQLFKKITGKNNLGHVSSSFEDFLKGSWQ